MENKENLIKYYNKFTEDKRLKSRHGQVEMAVAMHYINKYMKEFSSPKVLDVGAGTGAYSIELVNSGADVTSVELVKYNLGILKSKSNKIKAYEGDARNLKRFKDESFDIVLLFGPMYHLLTKEDKLKALCEAKRVVKTGGLIFISYLMNDYAIIMHGFKEGSILKAKEEGLIDRNYKILEKNGDLYSYSRISDIKELSLAAKLKRVKIVGQDGATDYIRPLLNSMDEETFNEFINYTISISERKELIGASSHVLDILKK